MPNDRGAGEMDSRVGWLALAGVGVAAVWFLWRQKARPPGDVGAHAWLVPLDQARREAEWTQHALRHNSDAKQG